MRNLNELLADAMHEINRLRNENRIMKARLDMFDSIEAILHTKVAEKTQGMSPDIAREIEIYLSGHGKE